MTIADIRVPLLKPYSNSKSPKAFKVNLSKTVRIPANTVVNNVLCDIRSKSTRKRCFHTTTGILTPATTLLERKFQISSPSLLLNVCNGKTYIQIANTNSHDIILYRNQTFGVLDNLTQTSVNVLNNYAQNDIPSTEKNSNVPQVQPNQLNKLEDLFLKLKIDEMTHLSNDEISQVKQLISKYKDLFYDDEMGLPAANLPEHEIVLDTDKPIRTPYRQIPLALRPKAEELIKDLIDKDIIEPSNSPYHSPAFIIKRGEKYRLVTDYRNVNKHVIRNYQPLPSIETITSLWADCQYWSVLDLHSAYFQLKLAEKSRPITACSIPSVAFFQFKRVPLGISSAVGYFQSQIERTLLGLKNINCVNYLDDIASGAKFFDQMLTNIEVIFDRLQKVGLRLKAEKTKLFQTSMNYLGFKMSNKGLEVDPSKTDAVSKMMVPTSKKAVRSFVGFCSFYRKFVKSYSEIMKPLTDLFKKDVKFKWGPREQAAFDTIREKLVNPPILKFPNLDKRFYLTCDASSTGIACVLQQKSDDGTLHPISYASNVLSPTQSKWSAFQREFYSLVTYCKKFKHFLMGNKFTVRTDNQALVHWSNFKDFDNPKLWRWFITLSQFEFDTEYVPSSKNESDGPSRLPRSNDPKLDNLSQTSVNINKVHVTTKSTNTNSTKSTNTKSTNTDITVQAPKHCSFNKPLVTSTDLQKISLAQHTDTTLKTVISWVKAGQKPTLSRDTQKLTPQVKVYYNSFNRLKIKDNILYRTWERLDRETPDDLICIPQSLTATIIKLCHDIPSGGHLGKPKTLSKIQSRFYWPKMELEISLYIDACDICIKKSQKQKPVSPLQPFNGTHPNDIVQFDLMENLPQNPKGFRSILVIVDRFTCWVEAVPLRDTKATTIARALLDNWIVRNGIPVQCHSDRGPQFTAEVMHIVFTLLQVHQTFTVAYRPMSDGAAEAAVKIVKNLLKGFCLENPQKWPDLLQQCLFAYRTSKHASTGYSPFFLHRGHSARLPMDVLLNTFNYKQFKNHHEFAYDLFKTLRDTYNHVEQNLCQRRDFSKKQYDKRSKIIPYQAGQYVYVWRPRPPHNKNKFFNHYFGPYKIIKKVTDYTYKLDLGSKSRMHDIVPHDLLRLANQENLPDKLRDYQPLQLDLEHKLQTIPEDEEDTNQDETTANANERPLIMIPAQQGQGPLVAPAGRLGPYNLRDRAHIRPPDRYRD